jgi:hypothetical protein
MPWKISDVDRFKKGLTNKQKRQWVKIANSALNSCLSDGGTQKNCEASAIRQANGSVGNNMEVFQIYNLKTNNYSIRKEIFEDREHIVVPVVMMIDGVHAGSHGPLLHTGDEYGKYPDSWNGIPVVVYHPEDFNGSPISANSPDVFEGEKIGTVFNATYQSKLRAEAWIDVEKIEKIAPLALTYINQQRPLDVSVGVFTDDDISPGTWNSEDYTAIARNHRPDHLALLPGEAGACSWEDGCGVRANQEKGGGEELKKELKTMAMQLLKNGLSINGIQFNIQGFKEICSKIQSKLDALDNSVHWHGLTEVFENEFIYTVFPKEDGGEPKLYRRGYKIDTQDDTIKFEGDPTPVVRRVEFLDINTNSSKLTKKGVIQMEGKEKKHCCPEQVKLIIQSEHTRFEESDRDWLETQNEGTIIKLLPVEPKEQAPPQVNKEQAIEVLKDQFKTTDQFLSLLPDELKSQMQYGLSLYKDERMNLVTNITSNSNFTDEDLKGKSIDELKKLSDAIKPSSDFSPMGINNKPPINNSKPNRMVLPVGVKPKEEKK